MYAVGLNVGADPPSSEGPIKHQRPAAMCSVIVNSILADVPALSALMIVILAPPFAGGVPLQSVVGAERSLSCDVIGAEEEISNFPATKHDATSFLTTRVFVADGSATVTSHQIDVIVGSATVMVPVATCGAYVAAPSNSLGVPLPAMRQILFPASCAAMVTVA